MLRTGRETQIALLEETISELEGEIPANPSGPRGDRLVAEVEAEVKRYFKALALAVDIAGLEAIYNRHVGEAVS